MGDQQENNPFGDQQENKTVCMLRLKKLTQNAHTSINFGAKSRCQHLTISWQGLERSEVIVAITMTAAYYSVYLAYYAAIPVKSY